MNYLPKNNEINRRNFVVGAASSLLGVHFLTNDSHANTLPTNLSGTAKSVIYLYMNGGMSHLDTFDIKPENNDVSGQAGAIESSVKGIRISKFLPNIAKQMDKIAIVNSLNTTQGAHEQGTYIMHTSYEERSTIEHPELGAWITKLGGRISQSLPPFIKIGGGSLSLGSGFFEQSYAALPIGDPKSGLQYSQRHKSVTQQTFDDRLALLQQANHDFQEKYKQASINAYSSMYSEAVKLMTSKDLEAFDISKEPTENAARYGANSFGQGCLLARRLVEKGVRFVEVNLGGWDHHNNIYDSFPELSNTLDVALAALLQDLEAKGLLKTTLVVVATEFGRTPVINSNKGRDHYPKAFSCILAGGGIKGGQIYGKTDPAGKNIIENPVSVEDFNATIATALGISTDTIVHSPSGRPFQIAHKGKPILAILR